MTNGYTKGLTDRDSLLLLDPKEEIDWLPEMWDMCDKKYIEEGGFSYRPECLEEREI